MNVHVCTSSDTLAILSSAKSTCIVHKWQLGSTFFPKIKAKGHVQYNQMIIVVFDCSL